MRMFSVFVLAAIAAGCTSQVYEENVGQTQSASTALAGYARLAVGNAKMAGNADLIAIQDDDVYVRRSSPANSAFLAKNKMFDNTDSAIHWFADVNGDGYVDMVKSNDTDYGEIDYFQVRLNDQDGGFGSQQSWNNDQGDDEVTWPGVFADFDGDDNADYVSMVFSNGDVLFRVHLSDGSGFDVETWHTWDSSGNEFIYMGELIGAADVNDDDCADIVWAGASSQQDQIRVMLANSSCDGFEDIETWRDGVASTGSEFTLCDADGDGNADIVRHRSDTSPNKVVVIPSDGVDEFTGSSVWYSGSSLNDGEVHCAQVDGANGDDIIIADSNVQVAISTSSDSFSTPTDWTTNSFLSDWEY